jgi:hypothetical protein
MGVKFGTCMRNQRHEFNNKLLGEILRPERQRVFARRGKLHNGETRNLQSSENCIKAVK